MHTVAILVLDDVVAFDLGTPLEVFARVRLADGSPGYEVVVCGAADTASAGRFTVTGLQPLERLRTADTIVVPGRNDVTAPHPPEVLDALRAAAATGRTRIASICAGAFTLAAAGLLDGRTATTHWIGADLLAAMYPAVRVDPRPLFVDEGDVLTSAGAAAGLDLCLHMVGQDHGAAVAADAARLAVVPLQREGDQAQFTGAQFTGDSSGTPLAETLIWLRDNCHQRLALADIARHAGVSTRTLNRRFTEQVGATPVHYLRALRVRRAKELLETTDLPVERVAREAGFDSPTSFRATFKGLVGVPPAGYRRAFRYRAGNRDQAGNPPA